MARPRNAVAILEELWLTGFKSFDNEALQLSELTLLIGENGSGKSNAIDGLNALARLAEGDDVRDALDGSRSDTEPIRGGAEGARPTAGTSSSWVAASAGARPSSISRS